MGEDDEKGLDLGLLGLERSRPHHDGWLLKVTVVLEGEGHLTLAFEPGE